MIRPEFWTDARLSECSVSARLLFIGTWTFSDDKGNLDLCPKQLKMQIFPGDDIQIEPMLNELIGVGVLIPYEVDGRKYLNIKNFLKYQIINRPSPSTRPIYEEKYALTEYFVSTHPEVKRSEVKRPKSKPYAIRTVFVPPSFEEVSEYIKNRNTTVDPVAFHSHYSTNGWRVGRAGLPMKDWKAAIVTWERRR